ncbi:MAG: thiamine-phosphate kinase [Immundisolibacterales bacterium]|nr:thiamine-phosphate kinase [Immundisolibacterales bacterium]
MTARTWRPEDPGAVAIALDTLVADVHFRADVAPRSLGHKALAVNLSDLAAMGAQPRRALVHAAHPAPSPAWEEAFAAGIGELAERFAVRMDRRPVRTGPLLVSVEIAGTFPGSAPPLLRSGARPGDLIYVTGTLGDAAGAPGGAGGLAARLDRPEPRVAAGLALRSIATSAIDVSDGLCADLGHVLRASGAGATLEAARLPLSGELCAAFGRKQATDLALAGGDDYELAFTVPPGREKLLAGAELGVAVSRIGVVERGPGLRCLDGDGRPRSVPAGYEHFATPRSTEPQE